MSSASAAARISVLMPAYNAERYVLPSVLSVLAQTFEDFELLVVDDCSTDRTPEILSSIQDRRLRILRNQTNLGIVGSLNRAMAAARGRYIARIDSDDYCLPTRFATQAEYLDRHPGVLLVGTETFILEKGRVRHERKRGDPDPTMVRWRSLVSNPVGHPTMMFRAEAVASLGAYLREEFKYAEDFDFSHRLLDMGDIAVLPESLVIYRLHGQNLTRTRRDEMVAKSAAVLARAYAALLGGDWAAEAVLVAEHVMAREPVKSLAALERLGGLLDQLVTAFVATHALREDQAAQVIAHAGEIWWTAVQASLRAGAVIPAALGHHRFRWSRESRPALHRIAWSAVSGLVLGNAARLLRQRQNAAPPAVSTGRGDSGGRSSPAPGDGASAVIGVPPSLYVVVDAEGAREPAELPGLSVAGSGAMAVEERAQAVFDRFGLRPIYLLDHAAASRAEACGPLRRILDRHGCAVGAGLTAELDERTLRALVDAIQENLRVSPLFVRAGRHGQGPRTAEALARLGFAVEVNVPSLTDPAALRRRRAASGPIARACFEPLAPPPLPSPLVHPGPVEGVALAPERMAAKEQIRLVRALIGRGQRVFVLHYRGRPLVAGRTTHARTEAEVRALVGRIEAVCRFFFEELGGMPGNPADLVPPRMRERIWPPRLPPDDTTAPASLPGDAIAVPGGK